MIGAILWAVVSGVHVAGTVDGFQRVQIPGTQTLRLEAHKYVIYLEGPGADETTPPVDVVVADERKGEPLPIESYTGSLTYSFRSVGSAQATVTPRRAGVYVVRTSGSGAASGFRLALGESIGPRIVRGLVGALVIGGVFGTAGVALLVATGVRRSRRRAPPPQSWTPPTAA